MVGRSDIKTNMQTDMQNAQTDRPTGRTDGADLELAIKRPR